VKVSPRARRVGAVLVVVFVLTTIWAAYYLYTETRVTAASSPRPVASYTEVGTNAFIASLKPNDLYNNSTEVSGGNVTLFTSITLWVNVTMFDSVVTNTTTSVDLSESFEAVLSTTAWSKTLFVSENATSTPAGTGASLVTRYDVKVASVLALANAIDAQLNFTAPFFTLTLDPVVTGTVGVGGVAQPIESAPSLNLTFASGLIVPSGLSYSSTGVVLSAASSTSSPASNGAVPYAALAASLGGLVGSVWFVSRVRETTTPPLDRIIAPYEEAIAETAATPHGDETIPVGQFADLVKIADTLGKPILRPTGTDPERPEFLVLDAGIAYSYRYPGSATVRGPVVPGGEPAPQYPATAWSPLALETILRLRQATDKIRTLSLDPDTATSVREQVHRVAELLRAGRDREAAREVQDLLASLKRREGGPSRGAPARARP
jgi:hypothetical protein